MKQGVLRIKADGTVRFLNNEVTAALDLPNVTVRRASHVEPDWMPLRWCFHALRFAFGDKGKVSEFTRMLPCLWRVNLKPVGGPILSERWDYREDAIDAEVVWLNQNFI